MARSRRRSKRIEIWLDETHRVRFTPKGMDLIMKVTKMKGLTLVDFCRVAALKEARLEAMRFREDKIEMAKKILKEDEARKLKTLL